MGPHPGSALSLGIKQSGERHSGAGARLPPCKHAAERNASGREACERLGVQAALFEGESGVF